MALRLVLDTHLFLIVLLSRPASKTNGGCCFISGVLHCILMP